MIYLDNAATTAKKPQSVARAVYDAIASGELGNPARGSHDCSLAAFREVYRFRESAARLFNVSDPLNIALVQNATDGLNRVLKGYLKPGDHVLSTVTEHNSVLRPLYQLEETGVALDLVGIDHKARLNYQEFEEKLKRQTRAVVVTSASNVTGNGTDIAWMADFCKKHGLLFILDASQGAGIFDLDMGKLGIDVLCTTGHKSLYGPQGTGIVALSKEVSFSPVFAGGSGSHSFEHAHPSTMPDVFESGTLNTPGAAGLTAGMEYVEQMGFEAIAEHLKSLERRFIEGVSVIPGIRLYGDPDLKLRAPVIGINVGEMSAAEAAGLLNEDYGIAVRPGAHCAPLLHEALGTIEKGILRFSFSTFTTKEEIDAALLALSKISTYSAVTGGSSSNGTS